MSEPLPPAIGRRRRSGLAVTLTIAVLLSGSLGLRAFLRRNHLEVHVSASFVSPRSCDASRDYRPEDVRLLDSRQDNVVGPSRWGYSSSRTTFPEACFQSLELDFSVPPSPAYFVRLSPSDRQVGPIPRRRIVEENLYLGVEIRIGEPEGARNPMGCPGVHGGSCSDFCGTAPDYEPRAPRRVAEDVCVLSQPAPS